jgi:hypothetical protein
VDGFHTTFASATVYKKNVSFFYPSTIAIDEPVAELKEYIEAKKAGEDLCIRLSAIDPSQFRILISRLPRINTDQTNSVTRVRAEDPVKTMLPIVRAMQSKKPILFV